MRKNWWKIFFADGWGWVCRKEKAKKKSWEFSSLPNTHPISFLVRWRKLTLTLQQTPSPAPACVDYFHIFFFSRPANIFAIFSSLKYLLVLDQYFLRWIFSFFFANPQKTFVNFTRGGISTRLEWSSSFVELQCGKKWKIKKLNIVFRWVGSHSHGDGYHCRPRRIVNYCEDFHSILITISRFLLRIVIVFHPQLLHLSGSNIVPNPTPAVVDLVKFPFTLSSHYPPMKTSFFESSAWYWELVLAA